MSEHKQNARQGFYQGQKVAPIDLNTLQDYTDKAQANIVASLIGYGVVNGFDTSIVDGFVVGVASGLAFNQEGTKLILSSGKQVNTSTHAPNLGEKTIKLGIVQNWIKSEPVLDSMGNAAYKKWTPTVQFIVTEHLEDSVFELAEIILNPTGITSITKTGGEFTTIPKLDEQLSEKIEAINTRTSALSKQENGTTLQSEILKLLGQNNLSLEATIINLVTKNLQIDGVPYIEKGSNYNGTYVKFACGLLICWMKKSRWTSGSGTLFFPMEFLNTDNMAVVGFPLGGYGVANCPNIAWYTGYTTKELYAQNNRWDGLIG